MGKSKSKAGSSSEPEPKSVDKITRAAMSREVLAAGLTAAAAAIASSPKARKAIRDAGLDAADSASQAATQMMTNASKLGSLIAEAVADAAQRVLAGNWTEVDKPTRATPSRASERRGVKQKSVVSNKRSGRKPAKKSQGRKKLTPTTRAAKLNRNPDTGQITNITVDRPTPPAKPSK